MRMGRYGKVFCLSLIYQCSFAHGKNELRKKTHINLHYRTKLCKQFLDNHFCPYGYRCQYLHNAEYYTHQLNSYQDKLIVWIEKNPNLQMNEILLKTNKL